MYVYTQSITCTVNAQLHVYRESQCSTLQQIPNTLEDHVHRLQSANTQDANQAVIHTLLDCFRHLSGRNLKELLEGPNCPLHLK